MLQRTAQTLRLFVADIETKVLFQTIITVSGERKSRSQLPWSVVSWDEAKNHEPKMNRVHLEGGDDIVILPYSR